MQPPTLLENLLKAKHCLINQKLRSLEPKRRLLDSIKLDRAEKLPLKFKITGWLPLELFRKQFERQNAAS